MRIQNSNSIIKIRFDGFLSCLIIKKPRIVDWPDHGGSVVRYYACLPFNEHDDELQKYIEEKISSIKSIQELNDSGFLDLLESGEYEFELWENQGTSLLYNTYLLNSNETIYWWHKKEIGMNRAAEPYSLNVFYPYGRQLMFTRPFETLDTKRIRHYEDKIKNGERPLAISIRVKTTTQMLDEDSHQDTESNTTKYILDGHHKLVAYQNLNIKPSYIVISKLTRWEGDERDESSLPSLNTYLFYYQIEHIVNNGLESMRLTGNLAKYIDDFLENSPRLKDTLVDTLYRNANDDNYQKNEVKRQWFRDRLAVLMNKVDNLKSKLYLDYHCKEELRRKQTLVSNWSEIREKL